jgi:hypothetical protein
MDLGWTVNGPPPCPYAWILENALRQWFGYGSWIATYWFVRMEPGYQGHRVSSEAQEPLGGGEIIVGKTHVDRDFAGHTA